jgi:hypothetical protein
MSSPVEFPGQDNFHTVLAAREEQEQLRIGAGTPPGFFPGGNHQKNICIQFRLEFSYPCDIPACPGVDPDDIPGFNEVGHVYFKSG